MVVFEELRIREVLLRFGLSHGGHNHSSSPHHMANWGRRAGHAWLQEWVTFPALAG